MLNAPDSRFNYYVQKKLGIFLNGVNYPAKFRYGVTPAHPPMSLFVTHLHSYTNFLKWTDAFCIGDLLRRILEHTKG